MRQAVAILTDLRPLRRFVQAEDGQDLLEYGLLAVLIAIIAIAGVSVVGETMYRVFWSYIASSV